MLYYKVGSLGQSYFSFQHSLKEKSERERKNIELRINKKEAKTECPNP